MTLESLMKHADENAKSRVRRTTGYPVKIAKIKHKDKPVSLAIDVYEEPKNCHFKDTTYWLPVYIPEEHDRQNRFFKCGVVGRPV